MSAVALDITVLAILALSAIIAFMRGFIKEVLTIAGLIGATVASYSLAPAVEPWFTSVLSGTAEGEKEEKRLFWDLIPADVMATALSYGSIFIGVFIVLTVVSFFISKVAQEMGLNFMDRSLGVVFGLARGFALLVLLYLPFSIMLTEEEFPKWTKESRTLPVLAYSVDVVNEYLGIEDDKSRRERSKTADRAADSFFSLFGGDDKKESKGGSFFSTYDDKDRGELERLINRSAEGE